MLYTNYTVDFTLFSAYLALENAFFICFGKQIYYNYLAVIFYLYGDISAASEYNKKRFILAERKKMLTFCSNSVNILEQ